MLHGLLALMAKYRLCENPLVKEVPEKTMRPDSDLV